MSQTAKFIFIMVVLILVGLAITNLAGSGGGLLGIKESQRITFSEMMTRMNEIQSITIQADERLVNGTFKNGDQFIADGPPSDSPIWSDVERAALATNPPVEVKFAKPPALQNILGLLSMIALPLMLFALVYFLLLRPSIRR